MTSKMNAEEKRALAAISRRGFIGATGAATLAALAGRAPQLQASETKINATADTVILLWMAGGMAQTETFDPKRYTPYENGLKSNDVLSTFKPIRTVVDNIQLSEGLERIGSVMDRGSLIRSYRGGDLGFILHSRHQYQWHTGYAPPQTVAMPHIGAVIAKTLGPRNPDMPAFIDIGQNLEIGGESAGIKAFHTAGFLGTDNGPFLITYPEDAAASVRPPAEMGDARFAARHELMKKLSAASPIRQYGSDFQNASLTRSIESAHRLLTSPSAHAFDLAREPRKSFDIYNTGRFGLGCLLARRLAEAGARFVEVTTEYIPFKNWDTHENGHERAAGMKRQIDGPISQLILDLEERGLLNRTLVVLASEFGRDMVMEGKPGKRVKDQVTVPDVITSTKNYGMHRHFTDAGSVLMFGGGTKKGFLYGKTADERPCKTIENPMDIGQLHATIYHALGIPPDHAFIAEKRPVYVTLDGKSKPALDLFA
jgi:hypothetical protein